ncbi:tyrosinase cofactor, partial [Streptomyces sp. NPDC058953]|uniref:apotyrosinase chaperone MelC1 n=1 Tax=Streptomyces sp. NPDC058953 TaxID=3346676 RepID=UPI00368AAE01
AAPPPAGWALGGGPPANADSSPGKHTAHTPAAADGPAPFDEVFHGRRIQGLPAEGHAARSHSGHGTFTVLIDGRELHVMEHGKFGWSSAVNHYSRFPTPLEAARTAVDTLKGAHLVPFNPTV